MELAAVFEIFELWRRWTLFWNSVLLDQDLRFPEIRRRLSLELSLRAQKVKLKEQRPEIFQLLEPLRVEFEKDAQTFSMVEIWILSEWNEHYLQLDTLLAIQEILLSPSSSPALSGTLERRLHEIEKILLEKALGREPSWLTLIGFRWRMLRFRDEIEFLKELCLSAEASPK